MDSFEEWISHLAESKGVSEEQIVHQMMSSYWVLDELTGMIAEQQSEGEPAPDRPFEGRLEPSDAPRKGESGGAGSADPTTDRELIDSLKELIGHATENRDPVETDDRGPFHHRREDDSATDRMRELREGLDRIEDRLDKQASEQRANELSSRLEAVEEASERVDALESRIEDFESRVEGLDGVEEEVSELREGLDRIEDRLDKQAQATERRTNELSSRLEAVEEEASERVDALESRVDNDLDSVEEILKYLLQSLNDVEDRTDTLFRAHSELEPLVTEHENLQRLHEIKDKANQNGARTARCEVCDNSVDIGLLSKPECPHCDRPFDDLSTRSWLWKTKHVLETGARNTRTGPLPTETSEESAPTDGTGGDSSADRDQRSPRKDSTHGFDWIGDS